MTQAFQQNSERAQIRDKGMKTAIISFSRSGYRLNEMLCRTLKERNYEVSSYTKSKYTKKPLEESQPEDEAGNSTNTKVFSKPVEDSVKEWTKRRFGDSDAIIFIGASGIAVRSIAPFVKSKTTDPAIVVVDEQGHFAISLLSGHIGGANELTQEVAEILHAQPVVTTATDLNHKFAVDVFARKNGCSLSDMKLAKEVSADLLEGRKVGFVSDFPWTGEIPKELTLYEEGKENPETGICVTAGYQKHPFARTLYVIPRVITIGVGCKKGTPRETLEQVICEACDQASVSSLALEQVASIDLKAEEEGILLYCGERKLPFVTYTAEELKGAEGSFSESEFVEKVTGVGNVCERAAILGSSKEGRGSLIGRKYAREGVTVALAMKKWSVRFE